MDFLVGLIGVDAAEVINWLTFVIAVAAAISTAVPSVGKSQWYTLAMKLLNFLALNIGKARNADDPVKP